MVPQPILDERSGASIGIIAYGSTNAAIEEGRDRLRKEGIETSYMRLRALPLGQAVTDFVKKYDRIYVVEMNQDGQMQQLVQLHQPELAGKVRSVRNCNGLPMSARFVTEGILEQEQQ